MFKFLWKLIKWSFVVMIVMIGLTLWINSTITDEDRARYKEERIEKCIADIGSSNCDENGYETAEYKAEQKRIEEQERVEQQRERERIANEAEYERQRQEEAKRIAEAEYRNSPEGKTENFMGQARLECRNTVKNTALYPSKVDFNLISGNDYKYFMNFNSKGESRVMITLSGEMMNGFGNMIPFTVVCKYDYNPKSNTYKVVEILI